MSDAQSLINAERYEQVFGHGYSALHDDQYKNGELKIAAICYLQAGPDDGVPMLWPWEASTWKPSTYEHNLVKAGALIQAEIERNRRANKEKSPS